MLINSHYLECAVNYALDADLNMLQGDFYL